MKAKKKIRKTPEIETDYDLELEKIVGTIKKRKAKLVCLQFPDGLKPLAIKVAEYLEQKTKATCLIWLGSCFGACDIPQLSHIKPKIDLLVQFGHSMWPYKNKEIKVLN